MGARNERRLCALNCHKTAGFEIVHGLLDRVMLLLEVPFSIDRNDTGYFLREADGKNFIFILATVLRCFGNLPGDLHLFLKCDM